MPTDADLVAKSGLTHSGVLGVESIRAGFWHDFKTALNSSLQCMGYLAQKKQHPSPKTAVGP